MKTSRVIQLVHGHFCKLTVLLALITYKVEATENVGVCLQNKYFSSDQLSGYMRIKFFRMKKHKCMLSLYLSVQCSLPWYFAVTQRYLLISTCRTGG